MFVFIFVFSNLISEGLSLVYYVVSLKVFRYVLLIISLYVLMFISVFILKEFWFSKDIFLSPFSSRYFTSSFVIWSLVVFLYLIPVHHDDLKRGSGYNISLIILFYFKPIFSLLFLLVSLCNDYIICRYTLGLQRLSFWKNLNYYFRWFFVTHLLRLFLYMSLCNLYMQRRFFSLVFS